MDKRKSMVRSRYEGVGQEHVFQHWSTLSSRAKQLLLDQLDSIEVERLAGYLHVANTEEKVSHEDIQPFSGVVGSASSSNDGDDNSLYHVGMNAIREKKVAALLLAGGQGTRLGFDGPKGMYDIGLTSGRTLFRLIAERIVKLSQLAGIGAKDKVKIPLYIMTSPMNHQITKEYFESNHHFGLNAEDVIFFSQGVLPCLSPEGKILMESPHKCAMAPDGNGGIYPAMDRCGVLSDMQSRGIEHIHAFAIDNALVKPADPAFIGYCIQQDADCGNKVLWKSNPHEKVGVIAEKDGSPCVVEYTELTKEMAERKEEKEENPGEDAKLAFGAANICNHYYHLKFLRDKVIPNLGNMFHLARKKIGVWDDGQKKTVTPCSNNGVKLESFIFDVFPLSRKMAIFEVERKDEFGPVKNAPGAPSDSPDTARSMLSAIAKRWLQDCGAKLVGDLESDKCEIGPLTSFGGEGLDSFKDQVVECPFSI